MITSLNNASDLSKSSSLLEKYSLDELLQPTNSNFNLESHWGGLYQDRTDFVLSLAKQGWVFLDKPCCMDSKTTFTTLQAMSMAAYLEKIAPNYEIPALLRNTTFANADSDLKNLIAAPLVVNFEFNDICLNDLLKTSERYADILASQEKRQEKLHAKQEELQQKLDDSITQLHQDLQLKLNKLDFAEKAERDKLLSERQDKLNKLASIHDSELKKLEQDNQNEMRELASSYKEDLKNLERELPTKLDEFDRKYNLKLKDLDSIMQAKSDQLEQVHQSELKELKRAHQAEYDDTADHTIAFSATGAKKLAKLKEEQLQKLAKVDNIHNKQFAELRTTHSQKRNELKALYDQRCAEFRKAHGERQAEVRALYRLQQAELRLAHIQKQEELKERQNQRSAKLEKMLSSQKSELRAEFEKKADILKSALNEQATLLQEQYEKDYASLQDKFGFVDDQQSKELTAFCSSLTSKLYTIKEETVNHIKQVYDFNVDWQDYWDEDVLSYPYFVNRCLNLCFAGGFLRAVVSAMHNNMAMMRQAKQEQLAAETQVILESLLRMTPTFLSGGLNSLKETVDIVFQLLPAHAMVLLLSDFDSLFTRCFSHSLVCTQVASYMKGFIDSLVESDDHIRFALMTGVTKYDKTAKELGLTQFNNLSNKLGFNYAPKI